jgi:hypothetical protein
MTGSLGGNGVRPKKIDFLIEKPLVPWVEMGCTKEN